MKYRFKVFYNSIGGSSSISQQNDEDEDLDEISFIQQYDEDLDEKPNDKIIKLYNEYKEDFIKYLEEKKSEKLKNENINIKEYILTFGLLYDKLDNQFDLRDEFNDWKRQYFYKKAFLDYLRNTEKKNLNENIINTILIENEIPQEYQESFATWHNDKTKVIDYNEWLTDLRYPEFIYREFRIERRIKEQKQLDEWKNNYLEFLVKKDYIGNQDYEQTKKEIKEQIPKNYQESFNEWKGIYFYYKAFINYLQDTEQQISDENINTILINNIIPQEFQDSFKTWENDDTKEIDNYEWLTDFKYEDFLDKKRKFKENNTPAKEIYKTPGDRNLPPIISSTSTSKEPITIKDKIIILKDLLKQKNLSINTLNNDLINELSEELGYTDDEDKLKNKFLIESLIELKEQQNDIQFYNYNEKLEELPPDLKILINADTKYIKDRETLLKTGLKPKEYRDTHKRIAMTIRNIMENYYVPKMINAKIAQNNPNPTPSEAFTRGST